MSEWWSYSPENLLMFSVRTYHRLFERHNAALWAAHLVALAAAVAVIVVLARGRDPRAGRIAAGVLAAGWLTVAAGYFWVRYATIHIGGRWMAAAFVVESVLLALAAARGASLREVGTGGWRSWTGLAVAAAAVVVYPTAAVLGGRPWPQAEVFGIAPDPTVLGTIGLLAAMRGPWWLWVVPAGWCAYSAMTLWALGVPEYWVVAAGVMACGGLAAIRPRGKEQAQPSR